MKKKDNKKTDERVLKVCQGQNCGTVGQYILERLEAEKEKNPAKSVKIEPCLCRGMCSDGPIVVEEKNGKTIFHKKMDPIKAAKIL